MTDALDIFELSTLADRLAEGLSRAEANLQAEQAVYGLDSLDEVALHSLLAGVLEPYYQVAREVHYPSTPGHKSSHRQRCDLVLTPAGRPLRLDTRPATLFDPPDAVTADAALWIEVKLARQFQTPDVAHGGYGATWRDAIVRDLRKMETDPAIRLAALLLLAFTKSRQIIEKDLEHFEQVLMAGQVLAGFRRTRTIDIADRMGHRCCTVALWPTIQRAGLS